LKRQLIDPVFIMSSERSGSNLLRTLLDNHSALYGPRAPQVMKTFEGILPYYANVNEKLPTKEIFEDMKQVVNHPFHDWKIDGGFAEVAPGGESFFDLWQGFYVEILSRTDAKSIVCKENNIFEFAFEILAAMPTAKFIYLYRDPRDVGASWMKVPLGFKNVNQASTNWHREQMACIKAIRNYNLPATLVSYEDLVEDTPGVMSRVLKDLNLEVEDACFQTEGSKNKDLKWNKYWENLDKPVMKKNAGKYKISLSGEEVKIIETRCKDSMAILGYERNNTDDWKSPAPNFIDKLYYSKFNKKKDVYKNKVVKAEVNAVLLDRAKLVNQIRNKRKSEWKA
jgi:hypothetical protein